MLHERGKCVFYVPNFPLADYTSLSISWEAVLCCFTVLLKYKIRHSITLYREWDGSTFITKGTEENKKTPFF